MYSTKIITNFAWQSARNERIFFPEHAIRVYEVTNDEAVLKFRRVKNENGDFTWEKL